MIFSRTSQYAIQTLIYIAMQPANQPVLAREVAARLGVPAPYLAKIMQSLSKGGLLESYRGPQGGFCLLKDASEIDLMQILTMVEGPGLVDNCVLGLKICSDDTPCPMHVQWKPIKKNIIDLLHKKTLKTLANAVNTGQYRIADLPMAALKP